MNAILPTIATPRLVLRAFTAEDAEALHRLLSEEGVLRYFPATDPPSMDRVQQMISRLLTHWQERGYGLWAVESQSSGQLLGRCGLQYVTELDGAEVDFILGKAFWGRGFATEAARASLQFGFELGLERVVGIAHVQNKASQRVLEKVGMTLVEQRQFWGIGCYLYAIERAAYQPPSPSLPSNDEAAPVFQPP
jgi:RimJ/RimL family protein N-acetyltransferase